MALRDRLLTPQVARAMVSPSGILLAGVAAAAVIVSPLAIALAPVAAVVAWGARVAVAVPKGPARERIDPFTLGEPWKQYVREAVQAQNRFDDVVKSAEKGPLRDRLAEIGTRIADGVQECWRIARRGDALEHALTTIDVPSTERELAAVEREQAQAGGPGVSLESTRQALRAQLSSAERINLVVNEARSRLRLLDARLDEAVARATELALQTGEDVDLSGLGTAVDRLVEDMEALRAALEETEGRAAASGLS
jgi:hypothetical protein